MINEKIYEQLKNNKITELYLNKNKIENIDKLSKGLIYNSSLVYLNLWNNKVKKYN